MKAIASILLLVADLLIASPPFDEREAAATILIRMRSLAEIDRGILAESRRKLATLLQRVGIHIVWADDSDGSSMARSGIWLTVLADPGAIAVSPSALGAAPGEGAERRFAYAFYDRVVASVVQHNNTSGLRVTVPDLIAMTFAHEMGHLLLPVNAHSPQGIMRPCWSRRDFNDLAAGLLRFSSAESELILREARRRWPMPAASSPLKLAWR